MKKHCTDRQNNISINETQEGSFRTNDFVEELSGATNDTDIDNETFENKNQRFSKCENVLDGQNQRSDKPLSEDEQVVIIIVNNDGTSHSLESKTSANDQNHSLDSYSDIDTTEIDNLDTANENTYLEDDSYILVVKEGQNDESYFNSEELEPYFLQSFQELEDVENKLATEYVCKTCGKRYTNKKALQTHYYSSCPQPRVRLTKTNLVSGKMKTRSKRLEENNRFTCKKCGLSFEKKLEYRKHSRSRCKQAKKRGGSYVCESCGKVFKHRGTLSHHIKMHLNLRNHPCSQCEKRFNTSGRLATHVRIVHKGIKCLYICQHCGLKSKSKTHIEAHEKLHFLSEGETPERPFPCGKCDKRFISQHEVTVHTYDYHRSKKCPHCPEQFISKNLLNKHKMEKHPTKYGKKRTWPDGRMKKLVTVADCKPLLNCPICDKTFKVYLNLRKHFYQVHGVDHPDEVKRASCLGCNKSYTSLAYYVFHKLQAHHQTVTEEEIEAYKAYEATPEEVAAAKARRKRHHRRLPNPNVKSDTECNVCHREFATREKMMNHRWSMHHSDPCYCEPCDKTFPNRSRFAIHRWEMHIERDESELTCRVCGKVFERIKSLLGHRVVHDGIVHDCDQCESRFKRKADLTRHMRDKHGVPSPYVTGRRQTYKDKEGKLEYHENYQYEDAKDKDGLEYHEEEQYEEEVENKDDFEYIEDDHEYEDVKDEDDMYDENELVLDEDVEYMSDANYTSDVVDSEV